jgi:hypothetical protein
MCTTTRQKTMTDTDTLHIYCAKGSNTKAMLEKLAKAHRRSLSAEVQVLIEEAYAKHAKNTKPDLRG